MYSSHPVRVRGLKFGLRVILEFQGMVAPRAGAWIEIIERRRSSHFSWSHPVRVRGLKFFKLFTLETTISVAPRAGAWIEIDTLLYLSKVLVQSHPVRVRGLKFYL